MNLTSISNRFQYIVDNFSNYKALTYRDLSYTYGELDYLSNLIAHWLFKKCVTGSRIGCAMTRSNLWPITLLGIMKARCVYVPLDQANPQERLQQIIDDCNIQLILHDADIEQIFTKEKESLVSSDLSKSEPNDWAYILYTSGTTGKPKGVPIRHFQVVLNAEIAIECVFHAKPGENILQMASINFLVSLVETFTCLLNGCHLLMADDEVKKDPQLLTQLILEKQVDRASIAPALLSAFPHIDMPQLKTIVLIGEPVAQSVRDYWMKKHDLVNCYGFTESALCICTGIYQPDSPINDIGVLTPCLEGHLIDEQMNEVPDGTIGELCVGGPSLTEGYWNRPDLNRTRFIENVYSQDEKRCKVLFRTGDLMVRTPEGHLLYKGRSDDQVKIRGMRIETREVEIALDTCFNVGKSVVVAREINGTKRLIAYIKPTETINIEQVKAQVALKLPDFMCPSVYCIVDDFPLTINRKINKKALPNPIIEEEKNINETFTPTEETLAEIWASLIGVRPHSNNETFLSLGGDSLSAMYLASRIHESFGTNISVSKLLQCASLSAMANCIDRNTTSEHSIQKKQNTKIEGTTNLPKTLKDLWRECQISPEKNAAYILLYKFPFPAETDITLLEQAWNQLVASQDCMRLVFIKKDNDIYGQFLPVQYQSIELIEASIQDFNIDLYTQAREVLTPERKPLYIVKLYKEPNGTYNLNLAIHHLITDGLSYHIMFQQLKITYQALLHGMPVSTESQNYRHYLKWKSEQETTNLSTKYAFWELYLSGLSPLNIPTQDNHKISVGLKKLSFSPDDNRRLKEFCRKEEVTITHTALSLFGHVVGVFLNQHDLVIGVASTDRDEIAFLNTMGYLVSILPIRTTFSSDKPLRDNIVYTKKALMEARDNILPVSEISQIVSKSNGSFAINIAYAMENVKVDEFISESSIYQSPFSMVLYANTINNNETSFLFQYDRRYFSDEMMESISNCFFYLMKQLLSNPTITFNQCELTDKTTKAVTEKEYCPTLLCRFLRIVKEHPNWVAYRNNGTDYTYEQASKWSISVAEAINSHLKNIDTCNIGVCVSDKTLLIPIILGLYRINACYVPIDPTLPVDRIQHIINDAQITLVISDNDLFSSLKEVRSVNPNECISFIENSTTHQYLTPFSKSQESPAYIIFTSGSTGRPKGIPISQDNLAVYCRNFVHLTKLQKGMRILQFASLGFDASVLEMFPTLYAGATIVFPSQEQRNSSVEILSLLAKEHISMALIPPSLLAILPYRQLPDLRVLLIGGESTPKDVQDRWRKGRILINAYGPTENTVMATAMVMEDETPFNNIGYPLNGVNCYVLDDEMHLLPDYAAGELYLSGSQLTSGYLNNPEQNKLHFVTHPKLGRLYKSGDKVMRTKDGSFLFLGRIDSQVKIRGFRIEMSEITSVIEAIPAIRQAYVLHQTEPQSRLIAYCVKKNDADICEQEVLNILSTQLPYYMVPSVIVFVDSFPLTINNKIDKKRLPSPNDSTQFVAPVSESEQLVADIVCKLLHKDRISVTSDLFFEGLTSIITMELIYQLSLSGTSYSYTDIYKHRTIRAIVANSPSEAWHWNNFETNKPVVVLVSGYTPTSPFYDEYIKYLEQSFSVLIFDSYSVYFTIHRDLPCESSHYISYMYKVILAESARLNVSVYAITGHSIGSELAILLGEKLLQANIYTKVIAIGTSFKINTELLDHISNSDNLLKSMQSSIPELVFHGDLRLVLELSPSNKPLNISEKFIKDNITCWKLNYPLARIKTLGTDHFGLLKSEYLNDILEMFT